MGCLRFCSLLGSIPGFRGNLEVREVPVAAGSCTRGCPGSYVDVLPKDLLLRDPEGWVQSPRCGQGWLLLSPVPWLAPSCLLNGLLQLCNCLFCLFLVGEKWSVCVWGGECTRAQARALENSFIEVGPKCNIVFICVNSPGLLLWLQQMGTSFCSELP